MRPGLLLQVHRHAEHHRLALGLRHLEGLAHIVEHAVDVLHADIVRAAGQRQRRHVDLLDVPGGGERRIAREHHQRRVAARRDGERRHDLGEARSAGRRGDADLAGGAGIAVGHGDGAVLVAGMHHLHAGQLRHRHRPVHVGVAHQGEQHLDALGREGRASMSDTCSLLILVSPFCRTRLRSHDRNARHRGCRPLSSAAGRRWRLAVMAAGVAAGAARGAAAGRRSATSLAMLARIRPSRARATCTPPALAKVSSGPVTLKLPSIGELGGLLAR